MDEHQGEGAAHPGRGRLVAGHRHGCGSGRASKGGTPHGQPRAGPSPGPQRSCCQGLGRRASLETCEANTVLRSFFSFGGPPMQWFHSFVLASWSRWSRRRLTAIEHPLVRPPSARAHVRLLTTRAVNSIFLLAFAGGKSFLVDGHWRRSSFCGRWRRSGRGKFAVARTVSWRWSLALWRRSRLLFLGAFLGAWKVSSSATEQSLVWRLAHAAAPRLGIGIRTLLRKFSS